MARPKLKTKSFSIRTLREWGILAIDLLTVTICYLGAVVLSQAGVLSKNYFPTNVPLLQILRSAFICLPIVLIVFFLSFLVFRVFKVVWRYARGRDYLRIVGACVVGTVLFALLDQVMNLIKIDSPNNSKQIIYPAYFMLGFFTTATIVIFRMIYEFIYARQRDKLETVKRKRTLIIGAGYTASAILEEISRGDSIYDPICMIDDDPDKIGRIINDIEVVDNTKNINIVVQKYAIDVIIFAIPSLGGEARQRILIDCNATKCQVKVLPYMSEMIENINITKQMRDINIADLLGRQQITFDDVGVASYIYDKVVMVTGGGGSIGSELCRQIAKYKPRRIVIVDVYENCAYNIQQEMLRNYGKDYDLHVEIVSITDYDKMDELFTEFRPQIIFHAAAHKHVPLMETVPEEAVKNNIFGTYNVALLADKHNVQKFIMVSTDKAVNPTNVMGATKRCCEEIVQMMAQKGSKTEFAAVRFGNVLGSNGSVIPLFKEQIEKGGPVTVTHPDIIRYFMTIPEAVSLVLQAGTFAHGGEIFVLDMGKQVKIVSLAENLIKLMGYKPYTDIDIVFTGLRPGEKLYEELLMDEEGLKKTDNEKIFIGHQVQIDIPNFTAELEKMRKICFTNDKHAVVEQLKVLVPTFHHDSAYLEKITEQAKQYQQEVQAN
ncbi:MAG: polysaccharide biosynthesis protein [Clostridia bacterium]|nr:polysaccharide biosynthesis protein [Clostridia bacterium]